MAKVVQSRKAVQCVGTNFSVCLIREYYAPNLPPILNCVNRPCHTTKISNFSKFVNKISIV